MLYDSCVYDFDMSNSVLDSSDGDSGANSVNSCAVMCDDDDDFSDFSSMPSLFVCVLKGRNSCDGVRLTIGYSYADKYIRSSTYPNARPPEYFKAHRTNVCKRWRYGFSEITRGALSLHEMPVKFQYYPGPRA